MPEFYYTARTPDGKLKKDRIRVKDEKALSDYLKNRGLMLTTSKIMDKPGKFSITAFIKNFGGVPTVQKIF
ncbi:hypothetical protein KKF61_02550, partial [Patescibacteria group bacterium]|nr:hypothetical protein [Patescibacteria group bacterium]